MKHTKEHQFLLLAARRTIQDDARNRLDLLLNERLDWGCIQEQAQIQRISSLIYHNCLYQRDNISGVPLSVQQFFQDCYQETYLQNTLWYHHLSIILQKFEQQGISSIALKGIVLAKTVYRNIALRPMQDIDLLLQKQDMTAASRILRELGYSNILRHLTYLSPWHKVHEENLFSGLEDQGYHLPTFIKKLGTVPICVELHHHIAPEIFASHVRSIAAPDLDPRIRVLTPEYFLLHLCFHLSLHSQKGKTPRLIWYCDIAELLNTYHTRIDWALFLSLCQQHQIAEQVLHSLYKVYHLFGIPVPADKLFSGHQFQVSLKKIFPERKPNSNMLFLHTIFRYGRYKGIRYLWESLFPSKKFLIARYKVRYRRLVYFYYVLRLFKACCRGLKLARNIVTGAGK